MNTTAAVAPRARDEGARTGDTVLVVDGHDEVRQHLVEILERAGLAAVAVSRGDEAFDVARMLRPALVLSEVSLDDTNGFEVCRRLHDELGDGLPVVLMSAEHVDPLDRTAGLMLGADDYIVKPFDAGELVARVRRSLMRSRRASSTPGNGGDPQYGLSNRELEILVRLASGEKTDDIARKLVISRKTVSNHLQRIFVKLGVNTQAQAVAEAYRLGLSEADFEAHSAEPLTASVTDT